MWVARRFLRLAKCFADRARHRVVSNEMLCCSRAVMSACELLVELSVAFSLGTIHSNAKQTDFFELKRK